MLRYLLFPFAILYDLVTRVRNRLYDTGRKPSSSFDLPIVGVGNLTAGGTGKTPMVEYLIQRFSTEFNLVTLSRGYGRETKGYRVATADDTAATIGDEPFQIFKKFGDRVRVVVGEERAMAIPMIVDEFPDTDAILLDDAFQHRKVRPSFQILLTTFDNPFYNDMLLPAGRLRESAAGAARADLIVFTKCPPHLSDEDLIEVEDRVRKYTDKPVFYAAVRYGLPVATGGNLQPGTEVILVTGIADPSPLKTYVTEHFKMLEHLRFADHYAFKPADVKRIVERAIRSKATIVTTEKDAARLLTSQFAPILKGVSIAYIPIEMYFIKNGQDFDEMALNAIKSPHAT